MKLIKGLSPEGILYLEARKKKKNKEKKNPQKCYPAKWKASQVTAAVVEIK